MGDVTAPLIADFDIMSSACGRYVSVAPDPQPDEYHVDSTSKCNCTSGAWRKILIEGNK